MGSALGNFPAVIASVKDGIGLVVLCALLIATLAYLMTRGANAQLRSGVFALVLICFMIGLLVFQPFGKSGVGEAGSIGNSASSGQIAIGTIPPKATDYILPSSGDTVLSATDVQGMSAATLRLARNEIYARHGKPFSTPDLAAYFKARSWYRESSDPVVLSQIEQRNVLLLAGIERRLNGG
jgi:hypothetical protein